MSIKQQYYTSCRVPNSERSGFQVKAESRDVSSLAHENLQKLIGYRFPGSAEPEAYTSHPISLRYYRANSDEAYLICAQSNGEDEFGRPGNFFAHSLIAPPNTLTQPLPPIAYWNSRVWVNRDLSDQRELAPVADLQSYSDFDFDTVWAFLDQQQRRMWLRSILCAVIDHATNRRNIVILDTPANVALWIAAVTLALPSYYRQFINFATYHHDPYAVPFMITGTTADSNFRFFNDEYMSYFILNTEEGRISDAPPSAYVDFVIQHMTNEGYENVLLDFFVLVEGRDRNATAISNKLDALTNFYLATSLKKLEDQPDKALAAVRVVLQDIAQIREVQSNDLADLQTSFQYLSRRLFNEPVASLLPDYQQSLLLLAKVDPNVQRSLSDPLKVLAAFVLSKQAEAAEQLQKLLDQTFGVDVLQPLINQVNFIQWIGELLNPNDADAIVLFWKTIGVYFNYPTSSRAAYANVFNKTYECATQEIPTDWLVVPQSAVRILKTLATATASHTDLILSSVNTSKIRNPQSPLLEWYYYILAEPLSLQEREDYRNRLSPSAPQLYRYEFMRDLMKFSTAEQVLQQINIWVDYYPDGQQDVVKDGMGFVNNRLSLDKTALAVAVLSDERISNLVEPELYSDFMRRVLSNIRMQEVDKSTQALYDRFLRVPNLQIGEEYIVIMKGSLALSRKQFNPQEAGELRQYFTKVSEGTYQKEAGELLDKFFMIKSDPERHFTLLQAVYVPKHRQSFWVMYWQTFQKVLLQKGEITEIVTLLDLWFSKYELISTDCRAAVPEFFMTLGDVLEEIKGSKQYNQVRNEFESKLAKTKWYDVIEKHFQKSRRGILGGWFGG